MTLRQLDLFLDGIDDRQIVIDNEVEHSVQDIVAAVGQQRRRGLELGAQVVVGAGRTMAHRYNMARAQEDVGLAVGDMVGLEMGGLGHDEQLVAIDIDLGHLPGAQGVLYGQGIQVEWS